MAIQTGLGNLITNGMSPGLYNVLLSKDFELKVVNKGDIVGYKCVTIWARRLIEIVAGQETPLPEAVSQFEMEIFNDSCSGLKNKLKAENTSSENTSSTTSAPKANTNTKQKTNTDSDTDLDKSPNTSNDTDSNSENTNTSTNTSKSLSSQSTNKTSSSSSSTASKTVE
jgi:hypothetical protein